jgi:subtilisin
VRMARLHTDGSEIGTGTVRVGGGHRCAALLIGPPSSGFSSKGRRLVLSLVVFVVGIVQATTGASPSAGATEGPPRGTNVIEGRYIVVYEDSIGSVTAETNTRERRVGFESKLRYRHAVKGFAAKLSPRQVQELRRDPEVDFVSRDRTLEATADVPLAPGEPTPPTGIRRILSASDTTAREQSGTNVAVIDTGIQLNHPDLNAADGTNCISPGSPANDGLGHGTHVAGTIAAKNNGFGVVGVAPDTQVYAVKVLDDEGYGTLSGIVCGIDWVTANASALNIGVANMSLGGYGGPIQPCATTTDALHKAICSSTAAGVNYVVSAGNNGRDFDYESFPNVPAAYPQVLTVTAISDSDGEPGGTGGGPSCRTGEEDDSPATFSNYALTVGGEAHTIAAPGVCIKSTWPTSLGDNSGYKTISGTSMASPHVAGVVALCINEADVNGPCASKTPAQVIEHVRRGAEAFNGADLGYGFARDPLHCPPIPSLPSTLYYGFLTPTLPQSWGAISPVNTCLPEAGPPYPNQDFLPRVGQTLSVTTGIWAGTPPIAYSYQWLRCDSSGESCSDISDATSSAYELTTADVGRRLRVVVGAQNVAGSASATSNPTEVVISAPPVNSAPPAISGTAREGGTLSASVGTWSGFWGGTLPITYSYQWLRCDSSGESCSDISGATSSAYELTAADLGRRLRVLVGARDAHGSASATSNPSALVAPASQPDNHFSLVGPSRRRKARVLRAIDGDTLRVRLRPSGNKRDVRLIGIDTPDNHRPGTPMECGGPGASNSMGKLAEGRRVTLISDPSQDRVDRYGRLLAYIVRRSNGKDLGRVQIRRGWAAVFVHAHDPFRRLQDYKRAQRLARNADAGVWGLCGGP